MTACFKSDLKTRGEFRDRLVEVLERPEVVVAVNRLQRANGG